MRKINELIWHCTATPEGREVSVKTIRKWHTDKGWKDIGYHMLVHLDGSVSDGRPISQIGAHVKGHNTGTIGYAYVGGVAKDGRTPKDTRTAAQKMAMLRLTRAAIKEFGITKISGHRQYANKACPSFDAQAEYAHLLVADAPAEKPTQPVSPPPPATDTPQQQKPAPEPSERASSGVLWALLGIVAVIALAAIIRNFL